MATAYLLLLSADIEPIHDQWGLLEPTFARGYPSFQDGISSNLIIRLLHIIGPNELPAFNFFVRTFAALLYLGAGILLAWQIFLRHGPSIFGLFVLLLVTSRYPFLWLSSELFAGSFLMLLLWSFMKRHPLWFTSTLLAIYATAKPDLIMPGLLVAAYLIYTQARSNLWTEIGRSSVIVLVPIVLLLLPLLLQFKGGETSQAGRSFVSFCQHYAYMVSQHQALPGKNPWTDCLSYVTTSFGPVNSLLEVIRSSFPRYMDFVFLSISFSIRRLLLGNTFLLFPPALYGLYILWQNRQRQLVALCLLLLANLIPILLLSYVHIRYQARFYPLLLLAALAPLSGESPRRNKIAILIYLLLLLFVQIFQFWPLLSSGHFFLD